MVDSDAVIVSERLELPLLSPEQLDDLAAGDGRATAAELGAVLSQEWVAGARRIASIGAAQVRERPADAPWLLRPILLRGPDGRRRAIGTLNFHAGPDERSMVEIG